MRVSLWYAGVAARHGSGTIWEWYMSSGRRLRGTVRRISLLSGFGSLVFGLLLSMVAQAWPAATPALAQTQTATLTAVPPDGTLHVLGGDS